LEENTAALDDWLVGNKLWFDLAVLELARWVGDFI
jgi:hypothetical protein